jgi:ribosomal protein L16 Arg81 hydroxylase
MIDWTLDQLLSPYSWTEFVESYWQQKSLWVNRQQQDFFASLVTLEDLDHLIHTHAGRPDFPLSVMGSHLGTGVSPEQRSSDRTHWIPERIHQRLAEGATLRIGNLPHYVAPVRRLAAAFETTIHTDVGINLYFTPRRARAFDVHFDNHDVFILQVSGRKRWKLFTPPQDLPLEVRFHGRDQWHRQPLPWDHPPQKGRHMLKETREIILHPGDLLYVPRGHPHQVCTTDEEPSLHLTVATPVVTWYEVMVDALQELARHCRPLRESLPVGFATQPDAMHQARGRLEAVVQAVRDGLQPAMLAHSLTDMAQRFVFSRQDVGHGRTATIEGLTDLTIDDVLRLRPHLLCGQRRLPVGIDLFFAGRHLHIPIRCASMVEHILQHRCFRIGDLPSHLGDESRLVLSRTLLEKGLLERGTPTLSPPSCGP